MFDFITQPFTEAANSMTGAMTAAQQLVIIIGIVITLLLLLGFGGSIVLVKVRSDSNSRERLMLMQEHTQRMLSMNQDHERVMTEIRKMDQFG